MDNMNFLDFNENIKELKKGVKNGSCRICGKYAPLTVDHIPPKSCGNNNRIKINYNNGMIISQNGLNCRTICENCNNNLLGANYDKELVKLYNEISNINSSGLMFKLIKINIDVKSLVRCLLGHMLAICVYEEHRTVQELLNCKINEKNIIFSIFRKFVLGETDILNDFCCYYWYYPYNDIIINPFFLKADVLTGPRIKDLFGTLIKFFPIAIYLVYTKSSTGELNLPSIEFGTNFIIFDYKEILSKNFPETPSKNELIMLNAGSSFDVKNSPL
jgi:hypothetical protein